VRVRLLGPIDVDIDGRPRQVRGHRRKVVLAALAVKPGVVISTDRLIEVVWSGAAPATAQNTLQSHISQLRQVLGARSAIRAHPPGYALDLGPDATDVEVAEGLIEQAGRTEEPHERARLLRAALGLWRGRPLADVAGVPGLDEHAERLDQVWLHATHALMRARLALGEDDELVPDLQSLTQDHPLDEQMHGHLILALYRANRQADALAAYHRLRQTLADDLGIDPSPALRDLASAILRQDPALQIPTPPAVALALDIDVPTPSAPAVRLGSAALVGRVNEVATLRDFVDAAANGTGGGVALVGEPGIGKTRLAAETARYAEHLGLTVLRGRAATPTVQFRPLSEAVLSVLRRLGPPDAADLVPYRPALSRLVPEWRSERPAGVDTSLVVLAEGILRLVAALGGGAGCVLVLEDLHDADADSLAVVDYLLDNAGPERLLIVITARTNPSLALELLQTAGQRRAVTMVALPRLGDDDVRGLAGACLGVPAQDVPEPAVERLVATADGVPLHVEELLAGMASDGVLINVDGRWVVTGPTTVAIPVSLATTLAGRVERLRPETSSMLASAALVGRRFPVAAAAAATGMNEAVLRASLREAVNAQVLVPQLGSDAAELRGPSSPRENPQLGSDAAELRGPSSPREKPQLGSDAAELRGPSSPREKPQLGSDAAEIYAFRHALTAEALRARMLPQDRAELSRRIAEAVEATVGATNEGWDQLTGELWSAAGEPRRAAQRFADAGRRAAAQGALTNGVLLLERALSIVGSDPADALAADIGEALVDAYADAGRVGDAYSLGARFRGLAAPDRQASLHLRLARAAARAGDWHQGLEEVADARRLLGPRPDPAVAARMDAVEAELTFGDATMPDRAAAAQRLAERALRRAEATGQPEVSCSALETLGRCARLRDVAQADALHERGLAIAQAHDLVNWKVSLLYQIGVHAGMRAGDVSRLNQALDVANRAGAVVTALDIELEISVVRLCRGELDAAQEITRRCEESAARLRLTHTRLIALGLRVIVAGHQGQRTEVDALLARFHDLGGEEDDLSSAVGGLGLAFCHLLHEEGGPARERLIEAAEREARRGTSYLSLIHGPHLFLSVVDGRAGAAECAALAASGQVQADWNRQFLALSEALLHGRAGRVDDAERAMARFVDLSRPYPLARHLGLRLIAPPAMEHGFGDPIFWLRMAEAHFHDTAPEVSRACRALLRQAGAPVPQHRQGSDALPAKIRERGITVREYEVLGLVAARLGNHEIGKRLFLSTRTVEKHVGSLLAKAGVEDRGLLVEFARHITASATRGA
jgi:DNA-binding SARP family transcriptional activator/DNA-binding CsgD family transcriptional regulator